MENQHTSRAAIGAKIGERRAQLDKKDGRIAVQVFRYCRCVIVAEFRRRIVWEHNIECALPFPNLSCTQKKPLTSHQIKPTMVRNTPGHAHTSAHNQTVPSFNFPARLVTLDPTIVWAHGMLQQNESPTPLPIFIPYGTFYDRPKERSLAPIGPPRSRLGSDT